MADPFELIDELVADSLLLTGIAGLLWYRGRGARKAGRAAAWGDGLWDRAPIGVAIIDYNTGLWLRVNPEVERILGYTSAELTGGMTWMQVTTADTIDSDISEVERVWRGEQSRYTMHKAYHRKTLGAGPGERVEVRLTVTTLDIDGEATFLVFIQDRSDELAALASETVRGDSLTGRLERALESVEFERERAAKLLREVVRRRGEMGDPNREHEGDGK